MLSLDRQNEFRSRYGAIRHGWRSSGEVYEATAREYITLSSKLLDLGCGRGGLPEKLVEEKRTVFGIDTDWQSLNAYRDSYVPLTVGTAGLLPYADQSFDLVTSAWLLEHVRDPLAVIGEVGRVLRPGGHYIFLTPNIESPFLLLARIGQLLPSVQSGLVDTLYARKQFDTFRLHYRANTARRLRSLADDSGLVLQKLQIVSDPTYLAFSEVMFRLAIFLERFIPAHRGVHLVGLIGKE